MLSHNNGITIRTKYLSFVQFMIYGPGCRLNFSNADSPLGAEASGKSELALHSGLLIFNGHCVLILLRVLRSATLAPSVEDAAATP